MADADPGFLTIVITCKTHLEWMMTNGLPSFVRDLKLKLNLPDFNNLPNGTAVEVCRIPENLGKNQKDILSWVTTAINEKTRNYAPEHLWRVLVMLETNLRPLTDSSWSDRTPFNSYYLRKHPGVSFIFFDSSGESEALDKSFKTEMGDPWPEKALARVQRERLMELLKDETFIRRADNAFRPFDDPYVPSERLGSGIQNEEPRHDLMGRPGVGASRRSVAGMSRGTSTSGASEEPDSGTSEDAGDVRSPRRFPVNAPSWAPSRRS